MIFIDAVPPRSHCFQTFFLFCNDILPHQNYKNANRYYHLLYGEQ